MNTFCRWDRFYTNSERARIAKEKARDGEEKEENENEDGDEVVEEEEQEEDEEEDKVEGDDDEVNVGSIKNWHFFFFDPLF